MFIFGNRTSKGKEVKTSAGCPSCGSKDSFTVISRYEYFHIWWIPFLPVSKAVSADCKACGRKFYIYKKDLNEEIKSQLKTPVWQFTGLALTLACCIWLVVWLKAGRDDEKTVAREYIESPMIDDLYEVKSSYNEYTLMKVAAIKGDTVFLRSNDYTVERESALKDLKTNYKNSFTLETTLYTKDQLLEKLDDNAIIRISRE